MNTNNHSDKYLKHLECRICGNEYDGRYIGAFRLLLCSNCGNRMMVLLDLFWRDYEVFEQFMAFVRRHPRKIKQVCSEIDIDLEATTV